MPRRAEHETEAIAGLDNARRYAEAHGKHAGLVYRAFLKDVRRMNVSGRCLEVGAGPGVLAVMLAEANPDVRITAIDLSADMAAVAEEHIREKILADRITYHVCDANDRQALEGLGTFDFVYSTFSLHHWGNPTASLGNLYGLLNEGGMLYIHDFERVWWARLLPLGRGDRASIRAAYTRREIEDFLARLGIGDYEIKTLFPFFLMSVIARKSTNKG